MRICFVTAKCSTEPEINSPLLFLGSCEHWWSHRPWEAPITSKSRPLGIFCLLCVRTVVSCLQPQFYLYRQKWSVYWVLLGGMENVVFMPHTWPKVDVTDCNHLCIIFMWLFLQCRGKSFPIPASIRLDSRGEVDNALGPTEFVLGLRSSGRKANVKWTEEKFFTNSLNLDFQQRLAMILRGRVCFF